MSLLCERRLVEAEAGRENERRVVLGEEEVDDVQEPKSATILVVLTNGDERRRDVRRQTDGVLDVEALSNADMINIWVRHE